MGSGERESHLAHQPFVEALTTLFEQFGVADRRRLAGSAGPTLSRLLTRLDLADGPGAEPCDEDEATVATGCWMPSAEPWPAWLAKLPCSWW